jgi:cellulase/cellobiase CelA1
VTNDGKSQITNWGVDINVPGNITVSNLWDGTYTLAGAVMSVDAAAYNQKIVPGASATFGYCATFKGADHTPTIAEVFYTD